MSELKVRCYYSNCQKLGLIDVLIRQQFPTVINGKELFGAFNYWYFCPPTKKDLPPELVISKENEVSAKQNEVQQEAIEITAKINVWLRDINNSPCWKKYLESNNEG